MNVARMTNVSVVASGRRILDDVTMNIAAGRIIAVVGANGAGKTTLLDALSGTVPVEAGVVDIERNTQGDGDRMPPDQAVGRVFQGSPLPASMTVGEILTMAARDGASAARAMERFGLSPHETVFVSELSTGMRRILDLALATLSAPSLLLLDEPASGLARSEVEHLAEILRRLRDESSSGIVLVEHDAWLVKAVADEVVVLDEGRIVERGPTAEVLSAPRTTTRPRVADPHDARFTTALSRVDRTSVPAPALIRRRLSTWTILRLGLRQFSAGLATVLMLGVLSRVLKVEHGVGLLAVALILSTYNLASPLGLPIGHLSDTRPIFGRRRVPYILAGASLTGICVAAAPHVAGRLSNGTSVSDVAIALLLFVALGAGMYGSGTVFFGLISDLAAPEERGHVAKVIYIELLVGIFVGVGLTAALVGDDATGAVPAGLDTVFALAGLSIVILTSLAVSGQERRGTIAPPAERAHRTPLRTVMAEALRIPQARLFFRFMVLSTLFFFMQQVILQPFGGDVFGMSISRTSALTGMLTLGVIVGMLVAGRPSAVQIGYKRIARWGLSHSVVAFAGLAVAAAARSEPATWVAALAVGIGLGLFNVATLALMMGMATRTRVAFFMGAWTLAHALADGISTAAGGAIHAIALRIGGNDAYAYAAVFAVEAIGLLACIPLLHRVDPDRFADEATMVPTGDLALEDVKPAAADA